MRTDDLVRALAVDAATPPARLTPAFSLAIAAAIGCALAVFWIVLGPRPDLATAATTIRFCFKFVVTSSLVAAAAVAALRLCRPGSTLLRSKVALIVSPALLALGVAAELLAVPADSWGTKLIGTHSLICLTYVPIIAAAPLAFIFWAMRRGAPRSPAGAGAIAGLLAGAIGAMFYAAQCPDDSPLFVATWYTAAIAVVSLAGAAVGSRMLRW